MRNRIIMAAVEEINLHGFKFTMSDLAKRLSISKTSLYEQFSSKNELVATLVDLAFADVREQENNIYKNDSLPIAEQIKAVLKVSPKIFGPFNECIYDDLRSSYPEEWQLVAAFREERLECLSTLLKQGVKKKLIRPVNFIVVRQMIFGAVNQLFNERFLTDSNITYADAIAAMADVLVYGLLSPENGMPSCE